MRIIIEHILWFFVVAPATLILTEALNVAIFPAIGVVLLVSITTTFVNALIKDIRAGMFS